MSDCEIFIFFLPNNLPSNPPYKTSLPVSLQLAVHGQVGKNASGQQLALAVNGVENVQSIGQLQLSEHDVFTNMQKLS